ncbi:MAG: hypothetical protein FJZ56_01720 [Chlamydiae bacterium]|nr:hypothetical protein [Chlamydiota bacterium]
MSLFKHSHRFWGLLLTTFGVFALIANMLPDSGIWCYWPIFLIVAGIFKSCCCCQHENDSYCQKK